MTTLQVLWKNFGWKFLPIQVPGSFLSTKKIEIKLRTRSKTIFINLRSSKKVLVRNIKTRMENGLEKKGQLVI